MMRHLHRDYHTAFCGIDASCELMTYAKNEADCADCHSGHARHLAEVAEQEERDRQELAERERLDEEKRQTAAAVMAARVKEAERLAREQAQRDAEQLREWINPA